MDSLNSKFIINLQGKSFVTYEGLLDLSHKMGLKSIEVEIIQIPHRENNMTAICRAIAKTKDQVFVDIGDASPNSVTKNLMPHLIRMASTRAKARALRDLTNIGMTAFEELSLEENRNTQQPRIMPATEKQIETIKQLSNQLNYKVDLDSLNKRTAHSLISKLLNQANNPTNNPK